MKAVAKNARDFLMKIQRLKKNKDIEAGLLDAV